MNDEGPVILCEFRHSQLTLLALQPQLCSDVPALLAPELMNCAFTRSNVFVFE